MYMYVYMYLGDFHSISLTLANALIMFTKFFLEMFQFLLVSLFSTFLTCYIISTECYCYHIVPLNVPQGVMFPLSSYAEDFLLLNEQSLSPVPSPTYISVVTRILHVSPSIQHPHPWVQTSNSLFFRFSFI